jgi:hypothetical protein
MTEETKDDQIISINEFLKNNPVDDTKLSLKDAWEHTKKLNKAQRHSRMIQLHKTISMNSAQLLKVTYDSFLAAGFSKEEAMELLKTHIHSMRQNNGQKIKT